MSAPSTTAVVRVRDVVKTFRRGPETVHALRGADLTVGAGELVGIAGSSGSGKSTLLAVLCGWERPDSGDVEVVGTGTPLDLTWSRLSLLPQTLGLLDDLPARENVLLPARLARREREFHARADALMAALSVDHLAARFSDQMSLGEQQRVAVARALLLEPQLVLADEPTAHQDARNALDVLRLLREFVDGGGGCVLVSHHQQALDAADVVLTMRDGRLTRDGVR
ncbi:ABC transporter ATP-binding protein [Jatrophihabitans fulvus]